MGNKLKWFAMLLAALFLIIALIAGTSYVSPWVSIASIKNALKSNDAKSLEDLVDWQEIRDNFTRRAALEMLRAAKIEPDDPRAMEVIATVEASYDKLITPENLTMLMTQTKWNTDSLRIKGDYLSVGFYIFAIENKETHSAISLRLKRKGPWSWKADNVEFLMLPGTGK